MKKFKNSTLKQIYGYLFISPWLLGFIFLTAYPMLYSLYLSFNKVKITADSGIITEFIKFDNYKYAFFTDVSFVQSLVNFLIQLLLSVPVIIVFALVIALLLNSKIKMKNFFRTIFFLPVIITSSSVINELTQQGATQLPGLSDILNISALTATWPVYIAQPVNYIFNNLITILWFSGIQILVFLAGLQKINVSMYEAAKIDGATSWEIFWKITLPAIQPLIIVNVVYTVVLLSAFPMNPVSPIIRDNMFNISTGFGYASALSWVYLIFLLGFVGIYALFTVRRGRD
ncbi:MAG TPA: sugar ABC transporter permease [Fervidobacterium sp.]|nr:sugar ABC transporter permease [Fervidobacterium sp.]HOH53310.1 sugar ABC transporter permease [Fervidobacterium sp.]HON03990.1 sugar ABC transporter permease [Fervidobacterium sp.]HOS51859.1 sugar ABC transporter permease [Fervidobacterium sp.]HPC24982.1 sugar ABC transporter permease [Fervidobacterium sp.]